MPELADSHSHTMPLNLSASLSSGVAADYQSFAYSSTLVEVAVPDSYGPGKSASKLCKREIDGIKIVSK